jgi:hypothetical protein
MAVVMIGVDPQKASHTAVAINAAEEPLGQLRVRAWAVQAERLLGWAQAWPGRAWAVEGAGGVGHLLAQQLVAYRPSPTSLSVIGPAPGARARSRRWRGQAPEAGRANGWWPGNLVGWLAGQWQGGQDLASDRSCLGDFG